MSSTTPLAPGRVDFGERPGPTQVAADRSYDIVCGRDLLDSVGERLRGRDATRAVVIADAAVVGTDADRVIRSLGATGIESPLVTIPAGEASKCQAEAGRLWNTFAELAVGCLLNAGAASDPQVFDLTDGSFRYEVFATPPAAASPSAMPAAAEVPAT